MKNYTESVLKTEARDFGPVMERFKDGLLRRNHAALGMASELSEIIEATDKVNLIEELGDLLWYTAIAADSLGLKIEDMSAMIYAYHLSSPTKAPFGSMIKEVGEFVDLVKKELFYGKKLEDDIKGQTLFSRYQNSIESILIHLHDILELHGSDISTAMEVNIKKLQKRYAGGFTENKANNRDLVTEQLTMEAALAKNNS